MGSIGGPTFNGQNAPYGSSSGGQRGTAINGHGSGYSNGMSGMSMNMVANHMGANGNGSSSNNNNGVGGGASLGMGNNMMNTSISGTIQMNGINPNTLSPSINGMMGGFQNSMSKQMQVRPSFPISVKPSPLQVKI